MRYAHTILARHLKAGQTLRMRRTNYDYVVVSVQVFELAAGGVEAVYVKAKNVDSGIVRNLTFEGAEYVDIMQEDPEHAASEARIKPEDGAWIPDVEDGTET